MSKKDRIKVMQIVLILGCWSYLVHADSVILPTIYWDPINPLFACETTIQVEYDDVLTFKCRDSNTPYSQSIDDTDILYESAYFLGTDQYMYNTCNATGAKEKILNCNIGTDSNSRTITFSKYATSGKLKFTEGETYYIIGTGFRVQPNIGNLINGSCNTVDVKGKYKLRLKIYVCSPEETCKKCFSDACYFKDCQVMCMSWKTIYSQFTISSNNSCISLQTRTCTNQILGIDSVEQREIPVTCPTLSTAAITNSTLSSATITNSLSSKDFNQSCTSWQTDYSKLITSSNKNCAYPRTRRCTNQGNITVELEEIPTICLNSSCTSWQTDFSKVIKSSTNICSNLRTRMCTSQGNRAVELEEVSTVCPNSSLPIVASVVSEKNNDQNLTYIAIFVSIFALLFGIFLGVLIHMCFIRKSECRVYQTKDLGMPNSAYTSNIDFKKENEIEDIHHFNNSHV